MMRGAGQSLLIAQALPQHRPLRPTLKASVPHVQTPAPSLPVARLCLALSMALVGSYVALSKPLLAVLPVALLAWLRFGIGGAAMLHWLRRPADELPLSARTHGLLFLESFLGNFLFTLCMLSGMRLTSALSAGVILATIPAMVALLSWAFLRERITPRLMGAIALACAGIALLAWSRVPGQSTTGTAPAPASEWLGNLLIFGAVVCEASYAVIGKALTGRVGPRRITSIINLWGFVLMTPLGLYAALQFDFAVLTAPTLALLLFYSLAASVWTVWLWMTGLRTVPAAQAGVFTVFLPVSAALVGVLVLGEQAGAMQLAALGLALAGVVLATWPSPPSPPSRGR